MAFTAGDITEITATNNELGVNASFKVKKGTDFTYSLGGVRTMDNEDGVTGDGEPIYDMQQTLWFVEGTVAWDMLSRDELQILANLSGAISETQWTFNCINGDVRGGTGKPVGDFSGTNKSEISIKIAGGGKLEKIG